MGTAYIFQQLKFGNCALCPDLTIQTKKINKNIPSL